MKNKIETLEEEILNLNKEKHAKKPSKFLNLPEKMNYIHEHQKSGNFESNFDLNYVNFNDLNNEKKRKLSSIYLIIY